MAVYAFSKLACPYCGSLLTKSKRRYGAPVVQCRACRQVCRTKLIDWTRLSPAGKMFAPILGALIPPITGWNILYIWLPIIFLSIPSRGPISLSINPEAVSIIRSVFIALLLLFALTGFLQTLNHINEAVEYKRTKTPPMWG